MENASRALIMAGSVLIALMVLGALMLMFNNLSSYQQIRQTDTRTSQTIEFNAQFETYNRTDVRGSELYSLLNRAVDYNRRQSTAGIGENGEEIGFKPIQVTFTFNSQLDKIASPTGNELIKKNTYVQSGTQNEFENDISSTITKLESKYGTSSLTNLTTGLSKIFIDTNGTTEEKRNEAVKLFNTASKKVSISAWSEIREGSTIRKEIYQYYEYVQFKRAHFDCTSLEGKGNSGVTYDSGTGRIIEMNFVFNGTIE